MAWGQIGISPKPRSEWDENTKSLDELYIGPVGLSVYAKDIIYDNNISGLPADNVQDAIDELDAVVDGIVVAGSDTAILEAGRNNSNVTNTYLRGPGDVPTNVSPFVLAYDYEIIAITASTDGNETWDADVYKNGSLVGTLSMVNQSTNYTTGLSIALSAGDKISILCNGVGINRPSVEVVLRKV